MAEAIKVAVRVRPLNSREKDKRCTVAVSMRDQTTTVQYGRTPKHYTYDFSYWSLDPESEPFATQEDVFRDVGKAILSNALDGFNGTLFAYGQTGSGKSYCMMGPANDPGVIPRSVARLFRQKAKREDSEKELQIWISYLEIYKEQVQDLLCAEKEPKGDLKIMDHPKLGVYVRGLQEVPCAAQEDVMNTLTYGIKKRVVAATNMNARSSRSHAVFTIKVNSLEGPKPKPGQKDERKTLNAKLHLIDLAGSERTSKAGTKGNELREGCAINQSLSALGMVIKALSEVPNKKTGSKDEKAGKGDQALQLLAPFRMSKLTFLLKDSLAGNSKTYMMATISPANDNVEETLSTLRFASSVKSIKTVAVQNKNQKDELIEKMEEEIRVLKLQVRAGGLNPEEASELVTERTRLRDEMQKDFQGELEMARAMQTVREQALVENGLSQHHITQAFGISKGSPYLLNMADDPMLAGCLIYLLKDSEVTRIGSHPDNTITMKGVGIPDFLCHIINSENANVSIELISEAGRVVVNGRLLTSGQLRQLHNGDHIFLGRAYALKLIMPEDAKGPVAEQDLSLEGLEDEYAALDDSPSWRSLAMYLDQVLRQMPTNAASELFKEMKKACQFCDEANELTSECRSDEPIHFEVDLTSSVPACVVIRVLYCTQGKDCQDEDAWETKYLWSLHQLSERVDRMRDYCEASKRDEDMQMDPIEDPWHEIEYAELSERLRTLELQREEARTQMFQQKLTKMRTMLAIRPSDSRTNTAILQIFLRFWKMHVEERREVEGRARPRRPKVFVRSPDSSPRPSSQKRSASGGPSQRASTTSNSSDLPMSPTATDASELPMGSVPSDTSEQPMTSALGDASVSSAILPSLDARSRVSSRRLTLKRNSQDSIEPVVKTDDRSRRTTRRLTLKRSIVENIFKPENAAIREDSGDRHAEDDRPAPVDEERQEAPESTPEVAPTTGEGLEADDLKAHDTRMLKMQLEESQEENLALQRQLDIAWQLCAVLRDFTLQARPHEKHPEPEKEHQAAMGARLAAVSPSELHRSNAVASLSPAMANAIAHVATAASAQDFPSPTRPTWATDTADAHSSVPACKIVAYPAANTAAAMTSFTPGPSRSRPYIASPLMSGHSSGGRIGATAGMGGPIRSWSSGPQVIRVASSPQSLSSQRHRSADAFRGTKSVPTPHASSAPMIASVGSTWTATPKAQAPIWASRAFSAEAVSYPASDMQTVSAVQQEPSPARRPEAKVSRSFGSQTHMLVIAMDYKGTPKPLTSTIDAKNMIALAQASGITSIKALWDNQCTKQNVLQQLVNVTSLCQPGDTFLFYYTGHGTSIKDTDGDEEDLLDEAYVCVTSAGKFSAKEFLTDDEFSAYLRENCSKEVNIIIISDCCHSGTICDFSKRGWTGYHAVSISGCKDAQLAGDTGKGGMCTHSILMAVEALQKRGKTSYSVGQLYRESLQFHDMKFDSPQDMFLDTAPQIRSDSIMWPLVPEGLFHSPYSLRSGLLPGATAISTSQSNFTAGGTTAAAPQSVSAQPGQKISSAPSIQSHMLPTQIPQQCNSQGGMGKWTALLNMAQDSAT